MYHSIDEFLAEWANESQGILKLFGELTNESLSVKVYDGGRTLGYLAWHIANSIGEIMSNAGLDIAPAINHSDDPTSVTQIIEEYKKQSDAMVLSINEKWANETLNTDIPIYGEVWKGKMILHMLVKHEIHHRAQMTVLMRQAGLKVPGLYGPSKEDWAAYGSPAMK